MSLDDEIRQAERDGDLARAERLKTRLLAPDEGYRWRTLDGKILRLHQMTDDHLRNAIKMRIRRWVIRLRASNGGRFIPHGYRREHEELVHRPALASCLQSMPDLYGEAQRRGMTGWFDYLKSVVERRCDDCGKNPRSVVPRGPADRFQCATCAKGWTWRCPKCGNESGAPDPREVIGATCFKDHPEQVMSWVPKDSKIFT